ncbi:tight junction protein ZO-3 isoform X2 [Patagioenas fasciata]|uniref:tight junction protein ZO-3 isoform X2 n=1 Tax=Patagioenas fasciata TaxID=372321 RepID=UPI003A9A37D3
MAPAPGWRMLAGGLRGSWCPHDTPPQGRDDPWQQHRPRLEVAAWTESRGVELISVTVGKPPRCRRNDGGLVPRQRLAHKGLSKAPWSDTTATSPGARWLLPGRIGGSWALLAASSGARHNPEQGPCSGTSGPVAAGALFGVKLPGNANQGVCGACGALGVGRAGLWSALPRYCPSRRGHFECGLVSVGNRLSRLLQLPGSAFGSGQALRQLPRGDREQDWGFGSTVGCCLCRLARQELLSSPRCTPRLRRAAGSSETQPEVGLRKGPVAAQRSRSQSVPPATGQGLPHGPAAAAAVPRLCWWVPSMEEMVIWEQHTVTLSKDPQRGFGFAVSGGLDHPNKVTGDTAVFVSDVVAGGPAMGRLQRKDHIVMVNGLSMENVSSSFAIQTLKTCGKIVNITLKRQKKVHLPISKSSPRSPAAPRRYDSDEDDGLHGADPALRRSRDDLDHNQGYDGDSSSERSSGDHRVDGRQHKPVSRNRRQSQDSSHRRQSRHRSANAFGHEWDTNGLALVSGFKRLPHRNVPTKPITSVLVKQKQNEEYGLKLGSQLFIKHIVESGLAARDGALQEGDLILKINGVPSEDMSLADTQQLIERTEGTLTLLVLRDNRQFLVNIADIDDSQSDSSRMDDISDINSEQSHPPSREASPPPPAAARMSSPEGRRSNRDPATDMIVDNARGPDLLEAVEGAGSRSPHASPATRAARRDGADSRIVHFVKGRSAGLRLAGGNDVGIFVSGVQEGSPAESQGVREGDQILQVNDTSFQNLTREEAVEYLMSVQPGEDIVLRTQSKQDIYRKMISSNVGDSFYIRTHFDFEKDTPSGLSFVRGDVFHVLDTVYRGRLGSWLAVRMGRDLQEQDKGIIPNQRRAEQIASLESAMKATSGANASGARAEFWKLRGLRGAKKILRKSREDLSALTKQGHYPPYERVVLKEASFKRPVVILGPIADIAMQKLSTEQPELFEIAPSIPRDGASSKVIKLDSVRLIAEKDKHALLDITPSAVERLNYVQYYPVVVFCEPESRQGIKAMRQWLAPDSRKSSRRLYAQANKMKKHCSHLFTATVSLSSNAWYEAIKDIIRTQQSQPVWTAVEQADLAREDSLELLNPPSAAASGYLTCDSRANSDYEDTDGEAGAYTDGEAGAYTDGEAEDMCDQPGLARSSEPAQESPGHGLSEQVPKQQQEPRWGQHHDSIREYEHDAVRKRFTRARDDSDEDEGYEWGPATDV